MPVSDELLFVWLMLVLDGLLLLMVVVLVSDALPWYHSAGMLPARCSSSAMTWSTFE